jgi:hypothetical protein
MEDVFPAFSCSPAPIALDEIIDENTIQPEGVQDHLGIGVPTYY